MEKIAGQWPRTTPNSVAGGGSSGGSGAASRRGNSVANRSGGGGGGDAFVQLIPGSSEKSYGGANNSFAESRRATISGYWSRERTLEELKTVLRAMQSGVSDPWQLTDLIFYARHPEMIGRPLLKEHQELLDEWNEISALIVHPTLNEVGDALDSAEAEGVEEIARSATIGAVDNGGGRVDISGAATTRFDDTIIRAVESCPGLSPAVLKSLLAQESNFNPRVINRYGYAGIAQFGRGEAREVGLHVGFAGSATDERLMPTRAIPAAARLLNVKAQRLSETAFARYGQPNGVEFWKFVLGAYNGGEGTVAVAMGYAYRTGLAEARSRSLVGNDAVKFAKRYASQWENLKIGGEQSPLGLAAARYFPALAVAKYHEIGNYPTQIIARAARGRV